MVNGGNEINNKMDILLRLKYRVKPIELSYKPSDIGMAHLRERMKRKVLRSHRIPTKLFNIY